MHIYKPGCSIFAFIGKVYFQLGNASPYALTPVRVLVTTTAPMTIMMETMKLVMKA